MSTEQDEDEEFLDLGPVLLPAAQPQEQAQEEAGESVGMSRAVQRIRELHRLDERRGVIVSGDMQQSFPSTSLADLSSDEDEIAPISIRVDDP